MYQDHDNFHNSQPALTNGEQKREEKREIWQLSWPWGWWLWEKERMAADLYCKNMRFPRVPGDPQVFLLQTPQLWSFSYKCASPGTFKAQVLIANQQQSWELEEVPGSPHQGLQISTRCRVIYVPRIWM